VFATRSSLATTAVNVIATAKAKRTRKAMAARIMELASMVFARVLMDGEVPIAAIVALEMANAAVETESVLRETATAIPVGLAMAAIFALASMIALNMGTATTEPACAKRAIVDEIVPCHLSHNHASVLFTACVAACNSAPRFMRPKALDRPMNATPSAHRNAFLNVLLVRCL